ncbi:MAG: BTAD domain-containing putative transcriptional regulator [Pseudonocardiales bacterium]
MTSNEVEIRLFGSLRVRRADGTDVEPHEWSTGKTADLLRLLAVSGGKPVPVDTILEALWPRVDRTRGSASLRTALCQIRRVLRSDCITRHHEGMSLGPALVDVVTFARLAGDCRRRFTQECWADVAALAQEAEALYVGDLGAHDPSVDILDAQRSALRELRLQLLLDAADASVQLQRYVDGVDSARRALRIDPFSERAYRALIRSHAGAGEIHRAVEAYDQCRAALAEELGIEPAPQTRALRRQLLDESSTHREQTFAAAMTEASQRVTLLELIAQVAADAGHPVEADEAYRAAHTLARRHGLSIVSQASPGTVVGPRRVSAGPLGIRDLVKALNRELQRAPSDLSSAQIVG